jgi:hypothetical protein
MPHPNPSIACSSERVGAAAEIRLTGRGGVFVAHACRLSEDGLWLHAEGRWRRRLGANHTELRFDEPRAYTWPAGIVLEIRWTGELRGERSAR